MRHGEGHQRVHTSAKRLTRMSQTISARLEFLRKAIRHRKRDSWRAGCIERVHGRFGGEGLVFLGDQDLAPYPTRMAGGSRLEDREAREMRDTETVLAIIRERGKRGLPLERIYRLLYNPDLFLRAYSKLYPN